MNPAIRDFIRHHCPNIPALRNQMAKIKIRNLLKKSLSEEEIAAGEASAEKKKQIVSACNAKWPKHTAEMEQQIKKAVANCRKTMEIDLTDELRTDIFFHFYAYGFPPDEYFSFRLAEKTRSEKEAYISDLERAVFCHKVNDIIDLDIFYDKYRTYQVFGKYFKREVICIESQKDYPAFKAFVKKHKSFVKKPFRLSRGQGIGLVKIDESNTPEKVFQELLKGGKTVLEELVVQTEEMARLNPSSVNTIRIPTFLTDQGVVVGPCRCRCGHAGSFVDNAGAGGILVGVDNKTGKLFTDGWDEYCRSYSEHPDNGLKFIGYQVPDWDQLTALVKKMAAELPSVRYISWDMAHTANGWVVIEANGTGQFIGSQIVEQRGIKKEVFSLFHL